jgi:hypothetical protein
MNRESTVQSLTIDRCTQKKLLNGFHFNAIGGLKIVSAAIARMLANAGHQVQCAAAHCQGITEKDGYRCLHPGPGVEPVRPKPHRGLALQWRLMSVQPLDNRYDRSRFARPTNGWVGQRRVRVFGEVYAQSPCSENLKNGHAGCHPRERSLRRAVGPPPLREAQFVTRIGPRREAVWRGPLIR